MTLEASPKPVRRWKRIAGIGAAIVLFVIGVGYFTLPYISVVGAPVAELKTGDVIDASFKGSDGQAHKLSDYRGKVLVLEWTSPVCEFTIRHYESGAMHALQEYGAGKQAAWLPISTVGPGSVGHLDAAGLQALLAARKISSPYIIMDETGSIGRMFGAHATPSAAVIDAQGKLAYMGAIDDNPWGDGTSGTNWVKQALDELSAGKSISVPFKRSYGCSIKYPDAAIAK
jgi:AhpC/TSA family